MTAKPFHNTTCDTTQRDDIEARPGTLQSEPTPPPEKTTQASTAKTASPGAPAGNANALKHGSRSHAVAIGTFPKKAKSVQRRVYAFRRWLLDALAAIGIPSPLESAVQSACRHEGRILLMERWLRVDDEQSPIADRLRVLDTIAEAIVVRDVALADLGLKPVATRSDAALPSYAREANR